ncbi:dual specificity protein kinase CLK2-like [Contarinia nasturtii]|uniref:dual specificity protein kinase CLK2-like n=1 Tax=Contarinia nasturtii TaxID=265458 RepID=UPI0012D3F8DB|nr:dual specificity protein kinase CLK2-like [Contarinia nasturtii]
MFISIHGSVFRTWKRFATIVTNFCYSTLNTNPAIEMPRSRRRHRESRSQSRSSMYRLEKRRRVETEDSLRKSAGSFEISTRRKQSDRTKRSHHRRSPTSTRHGYRQRHRENREERTHSTTRRKYRDRTIKDRSPVKVKTNQLI